MDTAAESTGKSMGAKLLDALFGPESAMAVSSGKGGNVETILSGRSGGTDWRKLGQAVGESIANGITTTLGDRISKWFGDYVHDLTQGGGRSITGSEHGTLRLSDGSLLSYGAGGTVPGPVGTPRLAVVHGGEEVRTPAQQQGGWSDPEVKDLLRRAVQLLDSINSDTPRGGLLAQARTG
jgi:ABC-type transport system substrate-binding protein